MKNGLKMENNNNYYLYKNNLYKIVKITKQNYIDIIMPYFDYNINLKVNNICSLKTTKKFIPKFSNTNPNAYIYENLNQNNYKKELNYNKLLKKLNNDFNYHLKQKLFNLFLDCMKQKFAYYKSDYVLLKINEDNIEKLKLKNILDKLESEKITSNDLEYLISLYDSADKEIKTTILELILIVSYKLNNKKVFDYYYKFYNGINLKIFKELKDSFINGAVGGTRTLTG